MKVKLVTNIGHVEHAWVPEECLGAQDKEVEVDEALGQKLIKRGWAEAVAEKVEPDRFQKQRAQHGKPSDQPPV